MRYSSQDQSSSSSAMPAPECPRRFPLPKSVPVQSQSLPPVAPERSRSRYFRHAESTPPFPGPKPTPTQQGSMPPPPLLPAHPKIPAASSSSVPFHSIFRHHYRTSTPARLF